MEPLVSIIVPVYNVENYLRKCLHSIEIQEYNNYEVILVNDGSTDCSASIIKEYTARDSRFVVIHQDNRGLSAARNTGIQHAKGQYIFFLDGDDYIEPDAIGCLVSNIDGEDIDIVFANGYRLVENKRSLLKSIRENKVYVTGEEYMIEKMRTKTYYPAVWLNLYSSKLLVDNQLYFSLRRLHEDVEWLPRVLLKANKVKEVDKKIYNYVIRSNSITTKNNQRKNGEHIMLTIKGLEKLEFSSIKNRKIFLDYLANIYLNAAYIGKFKVNEVERFYSICRARSISCIIKSLLFMIHPNFYYYFRSKV